ncbi:MAG: hydroxymethylglutaryl-CoA lyase [Bacteroidia bacterium]|nr:hydroxymethylglutaryl-CoA lyase [Bacteroidia bacterium]
MIQITECPRDAMQGITHPIPTEMKIEYINQLLKVGFDTVDFGSFVSPKAIPQMADTREVLEGLDLEITQSKLLAIVANKRGAEDASKHSEITYLGYPFSISETFQIRNTRKTIAQSLDLVKEIQEICQKSGQELLVYLSMAFGNPYGDPWSVEEIEKWANEMKALGIKTIALADTVGNASAELITEVFGNLLPNLSDLSIGAHFHAAPHERQIKIKAAWAAGCRRFDVAVNGFGGCPFAKDELVGNISTESLLEFCHENQIQTGLNPEALQSALSMAPNVFS